MDRTTLTITDEEFEKNVEAAVSAIAEKHRAESPPPEQLSEKVPASLLPGVAGEASTGRHSLDVHSGEPSTPRRSTSSEGDDGVAITGLLRSIQRPLSTIGRMFSEEPPTDQQGGAPRSQDPNHLSPRPSADMERRGSEGGRPGMHNPHPLSAEEAAARQASAEVAEAQRLHRAEHHNVVETLAGMFPDLDKDIISDVVYQKQGRVGLAVDACLALST